MPVMTKSPKGDDIVILSRKEYDRLLAAADEDVIDAAMAKQTDLAKAAGIAQGFLSEIESGLKTGDVTVLQRIAIALEISLLELEPVLN